MCRSLIAVFVASLVLAAGAAVAQEKGNVRIQLEPTEKEETAPPVRRRGLILDYREEMRKFVQSISTFARKQRPNFMLIAENGLDLLVKRQEDDETKSNPARTYIRSIDGIIQKALFYGDPEFGKPFANKDKQKRLLRLTAQAKSNGLKVLIIDYAKTPKVVDESYRIIAARGYIPFVAHAAEAGLNSLPPYPKRPYMENPRSILSLKAVKNFLRIVDSTPFGRQDEYTLKLHDTNYDMVVVDVFHGRLPLSKQAVETLKYKKIGARRLVLAQLDIGAAASYLYYWKPRWREGSPLWISAPARGDPDKFHVEYWSPEWQRIITGNTQSYIYGIIDQGFDGAVLGGLDVYLFFETGREKGEEEEQ